MYYQIVLANLFWIGGMSYAHSSDGLWRSPLVTIIGMVPVVVVAIYVAIVLVVRWLKALRKTSNEKPPTEPVSSSKIKKSR